LQWYNASACLRHRSEDVIEFKLDRRRTFAAVIRQKPAFVFVPYETEDNAADAADTEA
jgi:hypothetical protein